MKGENTILLFGEFLGVSDNVDLKVGHELHWETEDKTTIQDISSSSQEIIIVLNDGSSYSLGFNQNGQLGIGSNNFCQKFTKVSSNTPFSSVVCGYDFTVWKSVNQEIFIAGNSFSNVPQRFSSMKIISMDAYEATFSVVDESGIAKLWPNFIQNKEPLCFLLPSKPSQISCGNNFATALCNGSVYRLDQNGNFSPLMTIGQYSDGTASAKSVKSAANYSIVLDKDCNVWLYGQIGSLTRRIQTTPIAKEIRSIFAMPNYCAFINTLGVTYTFGENNSGQLADGTCMKRTRIVETNVTKPTTFIVGGKTFSAFVCTQFDNSLFQINMDEFIPGQMNCPFEKAEDMIDA